MVKRGEVRWYTFRPPNKRRPVVVLTRSLAAAVMDQVVVAAITSQIRGYPSEVLLELSDGMPMQSVISLDNISTVEKVRLEEPASYITTLSDEVLDEIREGLLFAFDLK